MSDMTLRVDTAIIVPVNLLPLLDDTDFKTIEDAIAFNAAGMDLRWNFVTMAGVQSSTAVTPTSGGVYDWTHMGDGIYSMEIPASGGGSINNDTEGYGWFSGKVTGVLPFRGPVICLTVDALVDIYDGSAAVGTAQTGDSFARLGAPAGASVSADILAIDNLVDDLESRVGTPSNLGSGATVAGNLVDIEAQTDDIGVAGAGLTALGDARLANLNATVSSRASQASVDDVPTNAEAAALLDNRGITVADGVDRIAGHNLTDAGTGGFGVGGA